MRNKVMYSFHSYSVFIKIFPLFLTLSTATAEFDSLVPFGGNQKFFATTFDRDAIESSINEHSTSSPSSSGNAQRAFNNMHRSVLDTPQSEWMSTTTLSSHQVDDQSQESSQPEEQTTGEKPPVKDDDFVLLFSHAIEIPLARTPQSIIESSQNDVSSSVRQTVLSHDTSQSEERESSQPSHQHSQHQDINDLKDQLVHKKKFQEVPVIFQTIPASSYETPNPFDHAASPSQPLVRMYSYLGPSASASNQEPTQYESSYIPSSSYRPEPLVNPPTYDNGQKYAQSMERPMERPAYQKSEKKFNDVPAGYNSGSSKFIPLSASYRAPILPFFPSMAQYGMPKQPVFKSLKEFQSSSKQVPQQQSFYPSHPMAQIAPEPASQKSPIASPSSAIRSLSNLPFFPRLLQLHQLLGGRRWL